MIRISQKCQYALRTLLELTRRQGTGPVPVSEVAQVQSIPQRFLELIVRDLRRAGILHSRRGTRGGYILARDPAELTVGEIIRLFDGPLGPVDCTACGGQRECPLVGQCSFSALWNDAGEAMASVYDSTSFQDLHDRHLSAVDAEAMDFSI